MREFKGKFFSFFLVLVLSVAGFIVFIPDVKSSIATEVEYFFACPNPCPLYHPVNINLKIGPDPPSSYWYRGITITITNPTGTSVILGPLSTDSFGKLWIAYTPTMIGNYTLTASYPGEVLDSKNVLPCYAGPLYLVCGGTEPYVWSITTVVSTDGTDSSYNPSLAVGSDGTVHIAWKDNTDYGGAGSDTDIFYRKWNPNSGWSTTNIVSTDSTSDSSSPSLAVGSDGTVHISWSDLFNYAGSGTDRDIFYRKWAPAYGWGPIELVSVECPGASSSPSLDIDSNGKIHVAWADDTPPDPGPTLSDADIFYNVRTGDGWMSTPEVVSIGSTYLASSPSLAVGSDGIVHVAWDDSTSYSEENGILDIFYNNRLDGSGWGTSPELISTQDTDWNNVHPSLSVSSDGTVHIAWNNVSPLSDPGTDYDIFYKKYVVGSGWSPPEVVSTESTYKAFAPSLAVGSDGTVHIAWSDLTDYAGSGGSDQDIFYKSWESSTGWTSATVVSTEGTPPVGYPYGGSRNPSLAVGSDGTVHLVWSDDFDYDGGTPSTDDIFYKKLTAGYFLCINVVGGGSVIREPIRVSYAPSTVVTFTADPYPGWEFGGWSGDLSGSQNPTQITMDDHKTVTATFTPTTSFLVVRGSNNRIYYRSCTGNVWGNWKAVSSGTTCDTPAATVQDDKLYMVVRGLSGDSLWFGSVDLATDSFSGWSYLSGSTPSKPVLIRDGDDGLCLVVRGNNNRIYYRYYSCSSDYWNGWLVSPTGTTPDAPAAVINGDYLHLVVRGMTGGIYHQQVYIPTEDYSGWYRGSGDTPSTPTLTSYGDDVVLVVRGNNNIIYYKIWNGDWPAHFTPIPEATTHLQAYGPAACLVTEDELDIVVLSSTGHLYHGYYDLESEVWEPWSQLSGSTPCGPALTN